MTLVTYAIQAHPERAAWAEGLSAVLDAPIAWAEPPYATADDPSPIWRTKRAALLSGGSAPFHCVIQDDAVLAPDFRTRLEALVAMGPYLYMLFFRKKPAYPKVNRLADRATGHFITSDGPILGPGLVFPVGLIADIVAHGDADTGGDDDRIRRWVRERRQPVCVPIPSLVDHRAGRSFIGHPSGRRAWRFG